MERHCGHCARLVTGTSQFCSFCWFVACQFCEAWVVMESHAYHMKALHADFLEAAKGHRASLQRIAEQGKMDPF